LLLCGTYVPYEQKRVLLHSNQVGQNPGANGGFAENFAEGDPELRARVAIYSGPCRKTDFISLINEKCRELPKTLLDCQEVLIRKETELPRLGV
jgi:hypothetical protein